MPDDDRHLTTPSYQYQETRMFSGEKKSINACHNLGVRPTCPCCGGGAYRKGKTVTKSKSRKMSKKAKKPKKNFTRETIRKGSWIAACTTIRE